ncbi:MAG: hypothetical protein AB1724_17220 [Thermodesulfobacteriota bacterium]
MKLNDFAAKFDSIVMTPEDNPEIQTLYNRIAMTSENFSVHTKKSPDYFRFLTYAAENHHVFGFPNPRGELEGLAALIIRPCYIDGRPDRVGHFLDLRFKRRRDRTGTGDWKSMALGFTRVGREIDELERCRVFHGSYITTNIYATAAIGKEKKGALPKTEPRPETAKSVDAKPAEAFLVSNLASYQSVNIYARKPQKAIGLGAFKNSGKKFTVAAGEEKDRDELKNFLDAQNRIKTFGYIYSGENGELERRFKYWDGFSMASFFIARDSAGTIIGAFGAFDPGKGRQIYIDALPPDKELIAKLGALVGLKVPRPNENIDILYLTSLELAHGLSAAERLDVFDGLLTALYKSGLPKAYHIVSFCDYNKQSLLEVVARGYMYDATPVLLYQLHAPEAVEIYRESGMAHPPGHEMVLM